METNASRATFLRIVPDAKFDSCMWGRGKKRTRLLRVLLSGFRGENRDLFAFDWGAWMLFYEIFDDDSAEMGVC